MSMQYSSDDMLAMVAELNVRRINMVLNKRARRLGSIFLANGQFNHQLSERQIALLATARKLHNRYERGQYRHSETELGMLNELAHWLIAEHRLNGNSVKAGKFAGLSPEAMTVKKPLGEQLPSSRYRWHCERVRTD